MRASFDFDSRTADVVLAKDIAIPKDELLAELKKAGYPDARMKP